MEKVETSLLERIRVELLGADVVMATPPPDPPVADVAPAGAVLPRVPPVDLAAAVRVPSPDTILSLGAEGA
eukprot:8769927-Prorocentrum_lima.AAC.1